MIVHAPDNTLQPGIRTLFTRYTRT